MSKRNIKYKTLIVEEKLKAILEIEDGKAQKDVAVKFQIKPNTLSTIYKNRAKLRQKLQKNPAMAKKKRVRCGKFEKVDEAIKTFVSESRNTNLPVSGTIIQQKAQKYGEALNCEGFKASNGWFHRFKKRSGLSWRCLTGDAAGADQTVAVNWINITLKPLLRKYNENDIYNGDETGLFYKCLPGKTFALKGDKCLKGKFSKERITVMLCSNMSGTDKITPLVIGKSKQPRCFKNVRSLPADYDYNRKAWMNGVIFEKWLLKLDDMFMKQHRKVLFFFDNCSAHKKDVQEKLKNIRLEFFPPNLTALIQPMDMGIIRCLKVHYRNEIVSDMLTCLEKKEPIPKINLLNCINRISCIWDTKVSSEIIKNCFRKASFLDDDFMNAADNIPLIRLVEVAERNFDLLRAVVDIPDVFDDYFNCDNDLSCGSIMTDEDIIEVVQMENNNNFRLPIENEIDVDESNSDVVITKCEMRKSLRTVYNGLVQQSSVPVSFFNALHEIENFLNPMNQA